jgi:hypothetical protein
MDDWQQGQQVFSRWDKAWLEAESCLLDAPGRGTKTQNTMTAQETPTCAVWMHGSQASKDQLTERRIAMGTSRLHFCLLDLLQVPQAVPSHEP